MSLIAICDRSPRSWYGDMEFEIIVLHAYIKGVERQIAESIDTFHREQKSHVVHEDPDEGLVDVVNEHYGIDDSTYSIEYIFEEYFPDLQWGSALITLFSLFEHQLDDLCTRFSDEGKVAVKFE